MLKTAWKGVHGRLMWGFYRAATIEGYTLEVDTETRTTTLRAGLVDPDAFKLMQRPLTFEAPVGGGTWRWPIVTLTRTDARLTATLGPEEGAERLRCQTLALSGQTPGR